MATVTDIALVDPGATNNIRHVTSARAAVADTVEIPIDANFAHSFASVKFFDGKDAGANAVTATAGTFTVTVKLLVNAAYEAVMVTKANDSDPDGVIVAATPVTIDWLGPTVSIKAVPDSIGTATHYELHVCQVRN